MILGLAVLFAGLLLFSFFSNPSREADVAIVVDDLGIEVKVPKRVRRVVSLVPSSSEMVCLLSCDRLVGGTRYDRFPRELIERVNRHEIAIVGGGFDPNIESIVKLKPDLILADGPSQQRALAPLKKIGLPVLSLQPHTTQQLERGFRLIGKILNESEKAEEMIRKSKGQLQTFQKRLTSQAQVKVFVLTWFEPMMTAGKASFVEQLIKMAGGENIFGDLPFASGEVNLESVLKRNPEVMVFIDKQKAVAHKIAQEKVWQQVTAVKKRRFCFLDGSLLRPTIQYADSVKALIACFHPEVQAR